MTHDQLLLATNLFNKLYPMGAKQSIVWQMAEGQPHTLPDNSWYSAFDLIRKGGGGKITIKKLLLKAKDDYPRNIALNNLIDNVFKIEVEQQKEDYIRFVMNLFEVTPKNKMINGIPIQGERKDGYYVLVWEYWKHRDAAIDEFFLEHLHSNIGNRIGDRLYIVAPANKIQFIDDYYEIEGVRYYFLKVPYQIIKKTSI